MSRRSSSFDVAMASSSCMDARRPAV